MENVFKIFYLIGLIGVSIGEVAVNQSPSFDWGSYSIEHVPAAAYGPPPSPPLSSPLPPIAHPAIEYAAPFISTESFEIAQGDLENAERVIEVNTPLHRPTFTHFLPSEQLNEEKKPTPSTKIFLPKENPPIPFHSTTALNTGEVFINAEQSAKLKSQRPSTFVSTQHLPKFQEIKQFHSFVENIYGTPTAVQNPNLNPYPQPVAPVSPHTETDDHVTPCADTNTDTTNNNGDDDNDPTDPTVIAVANANGQYYILSKDNTLQRVIYRTQQTKDDSINNGFTAHLRYSLVKPIRDPIYGYDDQGHLVRIYNKK